MMATASKKGIRIRLSFEEEGMLSEAQTEQGLNKSWYLVNPQILTIGQLSFWITVDFHLGNSCPNGVTLEMSGFALPPTQPTSLLQDAELVSVKRKPRLTAEELAAIAAATATTTLNVENSEKVNGTHSGGVEIRPLDAFEVETRAHQSKHLEKGGNRNRSKAVEIGLQLLRTKETVRRRKRAYDCDVPIRSKEIVIWKPNDVDSAERANPEKVVTKDTAHTSVHVGHGSHNKVVDHSENCEEAIRPEGEVERTNLMMKEKEKEKETDESGDEKSGPDGMVGSPGDNQPIVAIPHVLEAQQIQERYGHQQQSSTPGRTGTGRRSRTRENPSEGNDTWCRNRFDAWRKQQGMDISKTLEELPYEELGAALSKFFLMVCKDNGERYPSASLMNLYMSFNRMIGKAQQERIKRTGTQEEPFKIQTHPCFQKAGQSCHKAMELSRFSGVNKKRKKAACISLEVEKLILSHPEHQATFPTGVQKRLAYYLWTVFLIRGNEEMWNLKYHDFSIRVDEKGAEFLQYNVRARKHYKVIITKAQEKHLQPPVLSYDADVVQTFKVLALHMPPDSEGGHLFLSPIREARTVVWFKQGINVSKGMIRLWMNTMTEVVGLDGDYSSKSRRVPILTR